jgi:hypothetical protein
MAKKERESTSGTTAEADADPVNEAKSAVSEATPLNGTMESVPIGGRLKCGDSPIPGARVMLTYTDTPDDARLESLTDSEGKYCFAAVRGRLVQITYPNEAQYNGDTMIRTEADSDQISCLATAEAALPDVDYRWQGRPITGIVQHMLQDAASGAETHPLAGLPVSVHKGSHVIATATTNAAGEFKVFTEEAGDLQVHFATVETEGVTLTPPRPVFRIFVNPATHDGFVVRPGPVYSPPAAPVPKPSTKPSQAAAPAADGAPTKAPAPQPADAEPAPSGQQSTAGADPHVIEWTVVDELGTPVAGVPVQVWDAATGKPVDQGTTGRDGQITFTLAQPGIYHVHTQANPNEPPSINRVAVNSTARGSSVVRSSSGTMSAAAFTGASAARGSRSGFAAPGDSFQTTIEGAVEAVQDVVAYPVLTEEIGYPPSPLARSSGMASFGQVGSIGQIATKAISDVLGWQVKNDQKAFVGALTASFPITVDEGRSVAQWTPRSYAIQTDLSGGITGAQASIYNRAKDALDQSLPLLEGLYPLFQEAKAEDVTAIRASVSSQFSDLVSELGQMGGPLVARVTQQFSLLLGQQFPTDPEAVQGSKVVTNPDLIGGSLGRLRAEFGFGTDDDLINTVVDEQNATNFRIISDYVTSLVQSWLNNLQFFGLRAPRPFFGTQLVLLSRQLSVVAETVNEVRFTMDSVFIGPAERQTLRIRFKSPGDNPDMFFEDLMSWIERVATTDGPRMIQDGGKFAVGETFVPIATRLQQLVAGARQPTNASEIPPGYRTVRVQNALRDLSVQLEQLVELALPIRHAITPEPAPEPVPSLTLVLLSPSTVVKGQDLSVIIFGTGFDTGADPKVTVTLTPANHEPDIIILPPAEFPLDVQVLSENMLFASLVHANLTAGVTYDVVISQKNGSASFLLSKGLTVAPL